MFFPLRLPSFVHYNRRFFMKRFLTLLALVFTIGLTTQAPDAEAAKRMGGGKSMGMQRQANADKAPGTPAQSAAAAPGATAGAAAAPSRSWMGPVAGLAAGLGLAALASHLGFGEELANMLMIGLLAVGVMMVIGLVMRKRAANAAGSGPGGMHYARVGSGSAQGANSAAPLGAAYKVAMPPATGSMIGSAIGAGNANGMGAAAYTPRPLPADFDKAGFERNAKVNFIRLQAANDAGDLDDLRQFTTPEMFAELKMDLSERGAATQKSEVTSINANVIEVDEDADRYLVSVRFTGVIKGDIGEDDDAFDEIWHMMKTRQGNGGWVVAGIQQTE
jgi:predicted lipid-binding transport protein (Tim44 family)